MATHEDQSQWEEHHHPAVIHTHRHYHVTHNYNERAGGFDHLSWVHEHEHDHAEVTHSHYPHQNFEQEHVFEAHTHDHDVPVKRVSRAKAGASQGSDGSTTGAAPGKRAATRRKPAV